MRSLEARIRGIPGAIAHFEPRGPYLAAGRSLFAAAQAATIIFTSDHDLFSYTRANPTGIHCGGIRNLSVWCITGPEPTALLTSRILSLLVLGLVVSGYRPRWTCILHWYVTFSLGVSIALPNGGEQVARIGTMLLIPVCLGDGRVWQWGPPRGLMPPAWRGASLAALLAARVQVSIIYAEAAVSKILVSEWRDGTAVYSAFFGPTYGMPASLQHLLSPALERYWVVAMLTWGTLVAEMLIALCVLGSSLARRLALAIVILLHSAIIVALGLFSFGVIMIAMALIVNAGVSERPATRGGVRTPTLGESARM